VNHWIRTRDNELLCLETGARVFRDKHLGEEAVMYWVPGLMDDMVLTCDDAAKADLFLQRIAAKLGVR
jgi:hypothetical protein